MRSEPAPPADPFVEPGALALLRCPLTCRPLRPIVQHGRPMLQAEGEPGGPRYPVVNGIPVLLPSAAERDAADFFSRTQT